MERPGQESGVLGSNFFSATDALCDLEQGPVLLWAQCLGLNTRHSQRSDFRRPRSHTDGRLWWEKLTRAVSVR